MPIRVRLALAFALAALTMFAVSAVLFERSFRNGVETGLNPGLRTQAQALTRSLRDDVELDPQLETSIATGDLVAQVLAASGRVLDSTREAGTHPLVGADVRREARDHPVYEHVEVGREREPYRVLVRSVSTDSGRRVVVVGESLEAANNAVDRVHEALWIGGAVIVIVAGVGAWILAGAVLRPVERMRKKAAEISEHAPESRLPVPASRDELAALGTTINDLLGRLQHALQVQRDFVADASHELRTPIAVLRTELELATRRSRTREELTETIVAAKDEADRLARLIDALLFLAHSDEERSALVRESQPIGRVVEQAVDVFESDAHHRGVELQTDLDRTVEAPIDGDLVRRAVENLTENALRYAPTGSRVTVRARRDRDQVVIEVVDDGPGFPPEFLPHAFERFRRADGARTREGEGGTGLGLAIVQVIALAHGGTVAAANQPEGGAVLTIRLPAM